MRYILLLILLSASSAVSFAGARATPQGGKIMDTSYEKLKALFENAKDAISVSDIDSEEGNGSLQDCVAMRDSDERLYNVDFLRRRDFVEEGRPSLLIIPGIAGAASYDELASIFRLSRKSKSLTLNIDQLPSEWHAIYQSTPSRYVFKRNGEYVAFEMTTSMGMPDEVNSYGYCYRSIAPQ